MVDAASTKDTAIIGIVYFTDITAITNITAIFNFAAITYTVASIAHSHAAIQLRVDNRSCQGRLNTSALGEVFTSLASATCSIERERAQTGMITHPERDWCCNVTGKTT